jgi:hypothetical protein
MLSSILSIIYLLTSLAQKVGLYTFFVIKFITEELYSKVNHLFSNLSFKFSIQIFTIFLILFLSRGLKTISLSILFTNSGEK